MSDPIEDRLDHFDPGVPVNPMSPADIRRKGDAMRRRNTTLIAVGAAVAVAVIATPIAVLANGSDNDVPAPAKDPTPTVTQTTSASPELPVARDATLTAGELPLPQSDDFTYVPWQPVGNDFSVIGCHDGDLPDFGARDQAQINFGTKLDDPAVGDSDPYQGRASDAVFDFDSADDARATYDEVSDWISSCNKIAPSRGLLGDQPEPESVAVDGGEAILAQRTFGDEDVCDFRDGCDSFFIEHQGVAVLDTRVVLFSWVELGGNLTDEDLIAAHATDTFTAAIDRAAGRSTAPPGSEDDQGRPGDGGSTDGDAAAVTTIPDDFDLGVGLEATDGDSELTGPSATVDGAVLPDNWCAQSAFPPAGVTDQQGEQLTGPEYLSGRTLALMGSEEEAQAVLDEVSQGLSDCATVEGDTRANDVTLTVQDDQTDSTSGTRSLSFSAIYRQGLTGNRVYQLVQVGNAVLLTENAGEFSQQTAARGARDLDRSNADVVDSLCTFASDGC